MNEVTAAIARLRIDPASNRVPDLVQEMERLKVSERLTCPVCGKANVKRENFWRHRRGQACVAARGELERQIQTGEHAMRKLILCETIATSRK